MVSQSNDPTTGAPVFLATAAPDLGVDETEVAQYAADVGNRIVRANLGALDAYAYKRKGLAGIALDTLTEYVHDGTGWVVTYRPFGAYSPSPTGLNVGNGTLTAKYEQRGKLVVGIIELTAGSTTSTSANVAFQLPVSPANPTGYRHIGDGLVRLPAGNSWPIQARMAGAAVINAAAINVNGAAGTPVIPGALVSNTFPTGGAWGAGASLYLNFMYEAA